MQANKKTVVVTGSNKGIGFALVQALARDPKWHVILAARNPKLGQQSLEKIKAENKDADVVFEELDISSFESIDNFLQRLQGSNKKIDVLVNNAAIAIPTWDEQSLKDSFQTNYYGTIYLTQKALPLIPDNGKIISVSSLLAQYPNTITSPEVIKKWSRQDLTLEDLDALLEEFKKVALGGAVEQHGYFVNNKFGFYPATKLALSTHTRLFAQTPQVLNRNIQVYNLHPGYVNTDMSRGKGTETVEEGIDTILYLIDLPFELNKELQGKLFSKRAVIPLEAEKALQI